MSEKHTPGPWVGVDPKTGKFRDTPWDAVNERVSSSMAAPIKAGRATVALVVMAGWENKEKLHANARRIVACVNACEGIETSELEEISSTGGMLGPREDVARIAKQRDHLLAALEVFASAAVTDD
ncbi:MAG: hypothetical protein ACRCTX_05190, partial [Afipia sp.]